MSKLYSYKYSKTFGINGFSVTKFFIDSGKISDVHDDEKVWSLRFETYGQGYGSDRPEKRFKWIMDKSHERYPSLFTVEFRKETCCLAHLVTDNIKKISLIINETRTRDIFDKIAIPPHITYLEITYYPYNKEKDDRIKKFFDSLPISLLNLELYIHADFFRECIELNNLPPMLETITFIFTEYGPRDSIRIFIENWNKNITITESLKNIKVHCTDHLSGLETEVIVYSKY